MGRRPAGAVRRVLAAGPHALLRHQRPPGRQRLVLRSLLAAPRRAAALRAVPYGWGRHEADHVWALVSRRVRPVDPGDLLREQRPGGARGRHRQGGQGPAGAQVRPVPSGLWGVHPVRRGAPLLRHVPPAVRAGAGVRHGSAGSCGGRGRGKGGLGWGLSQAPGGGRAGRQGGHRLGRRPLRGLLLPKVRASGGRGSSRRRGRRRLGTRARDPRQGCQGV